MTPNRRRAALAAALAAVTLPLAAACGAGPHAQTYQITRPADGVNAMAGDVRIVNAVVVVPSAGGTGSATPGTTDSATASPSASASGTTTDGVLVVTVANDGTAPDTIDNISAQGVSSLEVSGSRDLPAGSAINIGAPGGATTVTVRGIPAKAGGFLKMRITLHRGGTAELDVPLMAAVGYYSSISASPAATGSSPSAS